MDQLLQEFVNSQDAQMRVDRATGVIRGVKLLGLASKNGRRYLPAALAEAARLYDGVKVNVNHPKGHPLASRDYQDRLGSIRNVQLREGNGLFGDLHFNPKHALAEQLLWDATHAPQNVGFSHNVQARTSRQGDETVVEAILKVHSIDLVADPATTRGLYESLPTGTGDRANLHEEALASVTLEELRLARPELITEIEAESAVRMAQLESEIDGLRASNAVHERRAAAVKLLREFHLPEPADAESTEGNALVSASFLETLMAAPDEQAMRVLVEERANLVAAARKLDGVGRESRPTSREQNRFEPTAGTLDAKSFARAIS